MRGRDGGHDSILDAAGMSEDATLRLQRAIGVVEPMGGNLTPRERMGWIEAGAGGITPQGRADWIAAEAALLDGADPDAKIPGLDERTPLAHACRYGRAALARWLLAHGAASEITDADGWTALTYALWEDHLEIATALVGRGADPAPLRTPIPGQCGETPLMMACRRGQMEMAQWLLSHGAGLEHEDTRGWTALVYALREGHKDLAVLLLARGAHPNARDHRGLPVWMHALERESAFPGLLDLLLDHGADPAQIDDVACGALAILGSADLGGVLDAVLAQPKRAVLRRRLLDRLTCERRLAWLPRSCAAETAGTIRSWTRRA